MQQFREKFLLLSDYLQDGFGAEIGEDVTIVKTYPEQLYYSFFPRLVSAGGQCPQMDTEFCGVNGIRVAAS
jgi:hypothetical protein